MSQGPYTYYCEFKRHKRDGVDVGSLADDLEQLAARHSVSIRGVYAVLGFRPDSDLAMWWIAESADDIQAMLEPRWVWKTSLGLG